MSEVLYSAEVTASTGSTVRMRKTASKNGKIVSTVKVGTTVEVLETTDGWSKIRLNDKVGWMMSEFLVEQANYIQAETTTPTVEERIATLEERVAALESKVI